MTALERIWIDARGGNWSPQAGGTQGIEYVRADLAAVQPAQVQPDPRVEVIARLVEAAEPYITPVQNADYSRQMRQHDALVAALAAAKAVQHE